MRKILLLGHPLLYEKSTIVGKEELSNLLMEINLMAELIADYRKRNGAGRAIAAPQIGLMKRIIVLNIDKPEVIINPELSYLSEELIELWDDCMSFPELLVKVKRHNKCTVNFYDQTWSLKSWDMEGDLSELIQHEYDHLEGILAIQRAIDNKSFRWKSK